MSGTVLLGARVPALPGLRFGAFLVTRLLLACACAFALVRPVCRLHCTVCGSWLSSRCALPACSMSNSTADGACSWQSPSGHYFCVTCNMCINGDQQWGEHVI
eukprot:6746010-Lingulodinium_polyedra.AAC.1